MVYITGFFREALVTLFREDSKQSGLHFEQNLNALNQIVSRDIIRRAQAIKQSTNATQSALVKGQGRFNTYSGRTKHLRSRRRL